MPIIFWMATAAFQTEHDEVRARAEATAQRLLSLPVWSTSSRTFLQTQGARRAGRRR